MAKTQEKGAKQPAQVRKSVLPAACESRQDRLFLLLDALLMPSDTEGDLLLHYFLLKADAEARELSWQAAYRRRRLAYSQGEGAVYSGQSGYDMLPRRRFELSKLAVEDVELRILLGQAGMDHSLMGRDGGRGLAMAVALYRNSENVYRELCVTRDLLPCPSFSSQILFSELPLDFFQSRAPLLRRAVAAALCIGLFRKGTLNPLLPQAAEELLQNLSMLTPSLADALSFLCFWRGDHERCLALVRSVEPQKKAEMRSSYALAAGSLALFKKSPACLAWTKSMLDAYRKANRLKGPARLGRMAGLVANLARFVHGDEPALEEMRADIAAAMDYQCGEEEGRAFGLRGFRALKALDHLRLGDRETAKNQLGKSVREDMEDRNFLSALLFHGARARLGLGDDSAALSDWFAMVKDLPVLKRLFADVIASTPRFPYKEGWARRESEKWLLDLSSLVEEMPSWMLGLNALERLALDADRDDGSSAAKRIVWVVDVEADSVECLEQSRGAKGWTRGRQVALKRLHDKSGDWSSFTARDKRVAACVKLERNWWQNSYSLSLKDVVEELEGAETLYEREKGVLSPLRLRRGRLEMHLRETAGERFVLDFGSVEVPEDQEEKLFFSRPQKGLVLYYRLSRRERQVASIVGKGMEFPKDSLQRVLNLTRSRLDLALCTEDVPAEKVEADTSPVIQLEQNQDGFDAVLGVRPFGRRDTVFFPCGEGAQSPIATLPLEEAGKEAGTAGTERAETGGDAAPRPTRHIRVERDVSAGKAALDSLVRACPALAANLQDRHWYSGDLEEVLALLEELKGCGLPNRVEWPKGGRIRLRGRLDSGSVKVRIRASGADWFGVSGDVAIDEGRLVSLSSMLSSLEGSRFVDLGDGDYVALTADLRRKLSSLKLVGVEGRKDQVMVNSLASAAVEQALADMDVEVDEKWSCSVERMRQAFAAKPRIPGLLKADLREYQREGYEWMQRLAIWGVGACLADDMGLGKTLQAIAVMLNQSAKGPCLVVAPTSVCANWELEIERFAPSLSTKRLGLTGRRETIDALGEGEVLILGYGLLPKVQKDLASRNWAMVVFDEAQALKNAATKRSKAGRSVKADFRLALTGTPIENRIDDLWSLFDIINPGLLGSWDSFCKRYGTAAPGTSASRALRAVVRPFLLRRLKGAVLDELPEKTEQNLIVEPNEKELAFYETIRRRAVERLSTDEGDGSGSRRFRILAELTKLRRACCHPGLADPDMLALEKHSSKTLQFLETVSDLIAGGHKVLAFSQFTSYLAQISQALKEKGISFQYLDGQTSEKERRRRVAAFQKGEGDVFLLSLKAGGTGINLTAADYVIHLDPWWNPAVEDQASDRAHRIGQKRPVTIYRMVQGGSVEEKILALHASKRELAADFLEGTQEGVSKLTEEDLLRLMQ